MTMFLGINAKNKNKKIVIFSIVILVIIGISSLIFFQKRQEYQEYQEYYWHINFMDYDILHKYSTGKSQKIALIDSGISEFQLNQNTKSIVLTGGKYDEYGHGTSLYSLIRGCNQFDGIAPDVDIVSIKVTGSNNKIEPKALLEAIRLSIENRCTVINISSGSYLENEEISKAIDYGVSKGIIFVSSSGDYGQNYMLFPAKKLNVISVGALSKNGRKAEFTSAANNCTILAPGDNIKSINTKNELQEVYGTSEATAIISGYISLLKDCNSELSFEQIKNILISINNNKLSYVDALKSQQ